jgi:thioesterase domain-containing protein/NRPS condensation-like uncharacterized protein/acyl carrier protein
MSVSDTKKHEKDPIVDLFPLSLNQQRLWILDQLDPASAAYIIPVCLRLKGPLVIETLQRSLDGVVARHATLRTTFDVRDGGPVQLVHRSFAIPLRLSDISANPEADQEALASSIALREAYDPLDLKNGPLVRVALIRLSPDHHIMVSAIHHIVSDGRSMELFVSELAERYEAYAANKEPSFEALPIRYSDFTHLQRDMVASNRIERQLAFWRTTLAGAPATHNLPCDRARPKHPTRSGGSLTLRLNSDLVADLQQFARNQRATFFMVMAAAFEVLVFKLSKQRDILIGLPVSGRNLIETETLIGPFINTIVLRASLDENQPFVDVLHQVRHNLLEAMSNQDAPFDLIVDAVRAPRNPLYNPIFQIMFSVFRAAVQSRRFGPLTATPYIVESTTARFDLSVNVIEGFEGAWWLQAEYSAELFDRARIARMLEAYTALLQNIPSGSRARLSDMQVSGRAPLEDARPAAETVVERGSVSSLPSSISATGASGVTGGHGGPSFDARTAARVRNVEGKLTEMWQRRLKTSPINIDDNFFDLGGNSLLAISLVSEVNSAFGAAIPVSSLFHDATIRSMAARLCGLHVQKSFFFPLCEGGALPPLFAAGCSYEFRDLSRALGPDQPFYQMDIYALQEERLISGVPLLETLEDIASLFVIEIQSIQPHGPYFLAGQCEGGIVALEIARQLRQRGHEIATLMQFDTPVTGYFERLSWLKRLSWTLGQRQFWEVTYRLGKNKIRKTFFSRTPSTEDHIWAVIWDAVRTYGTDRKFEGEVILFRAEQQLWPTDNLSLGWNKFGAVNIYDVPGDHVNLFTVPATQRIVQRVLADAQQRFSSGNGKLREQEQ